MEIQAREPQMTPKLERSAGAPAVVFLTHDTWNPMFDRRTQVKAEYLADKGFDVYILTSSFFRGDLVHRLEKFTVIECGTSACFQPEMSTVTESLSGKAPRLSFSSVKATFWDHARHRVRVFIRKSGRVLIRNIEKLPIPTGPITGFLYEKTERNFSFRFTKVLKALCFDVIVAEDLNALISVEYWDKNFPNVCYDAHELFPEQTSLSTPRRSWLARKQKETLKRVKVLVAINDFHVKYFHQLNSDIPTTAVISNGLTSRPSDSVTGVRPRSLRESYPDERIWLYHGIINPERNLQNLIEAFDRAELLDVRLVIMGFYSDHNRDFAKRLQNQSSNRVSMIPAVPGSQLGHVCEGVEAIVIPYSAVDLNFAYCFPNKMGDALEWKIPVLFNSTLLGIQEIIALTGVGVSVDFDSPDLALEQLRSVREKGFPPADFSLADELYGSKSVLNGLETFAKGVGDLVDFP